MVIMIFIWNILHIPKLKGDYGNVYMEILRNLSSMEEYGRGGNR